MKATIEFTTRATPGTWSAIDSAVLISRDDLTTPLRYTTWSMVCTLTAFGSIKEHRSSCDTTVAVMIASPGQPRNPHFSYVWYSAQPERAAVKNRMQADAQSRTVWRRQRTAWERQRNVPVTADILHTRLLRYIVARPSPRGNISGRSKPHPGPRAGLNPLVVA